MFWFHEDESDVVNLKLEESSNAPVAPPTQIHFSNFTEYHLFKSLREIAVPQGEPRRTRTAEN